MRCLSLRSMIYSPLLLSLQTYLSYAQDGTGEAPAPRATIEAGVVVGKTALLPAALSPVNQFLGIPFAQSPPERFSLAKAAKPWSKPLTTTEWSASCMQQFPYPKEAADLSRRLYNNPAPNESEDCLYLNIYAPSEPAPPKGRAVLFWIYGGSLRIGNAGQTAYDGTSFAAYEDVIVVTANYRTNVFGFVDSPELPLTERNLAFLDQRFALQWVQRNIHAFGGDPKKVTIFGESAGGFSIDALLTSHGKNSTPPYRAAILQSGQSSYSAVTFPPGNAAWTNLTATLGCPGTYGSNLTCVRAAEATKIQQIINEFSLVFRPVGDNVTFVTDPVERRKRGDIAWTPVLGGTNAQESRVFNIRNQNLTKYLEGTFGNKTDLIATLREEYAIGSPGIRNEYDATSQIATEMDFQCVQAFWANDTASIGIPTWRYYFNASFLNTQRYPNLGAFHTSEIPLVFRTYKQLLGDGNTTTQQYALSQTLQSVWAKFAKNPLAGPGWNPVGSGAEGPILLGTNTTILGSVLENENTTQVFEGEWNLGAFGNIGNIRGSGVTILPQSQVDYRCHLFKPLYDAAGWLKSGN